jgi:hypothetical protein
LVPNNPCKIFLVRASSHSRVEGVWENPEGSLHNPTTILHSVCQFWPGEELTEVTREKCQNPLKIKELEREKWKVVRRGFDRTASRWKAIVHFTAKMAIQEGPEGRAISYCIDVCRILM